MAKQPNIPSDDEIIEAEIDTSDAFARVPTEPREPPPDQSDKSARKKSGGKKGSARAPVVERVERVPPPDDDGMDPLDAAEEIIGLMDQMFAMAVMFRGYDQINIPDGNGGARPMLEIAAPDDKARERTKKAVARMLKNAGATMSPGMGLAFTMFGCYGAPIIALEVARAALKKQQKAG